MFKEPKHSDRERRETEAGFSLESISSQLATKQTNDKQMLINKKKQRKEKADKLTYLLKEGIFCVLLLIASILEPSVTSSVYFLYFLMIGSWFGLNRSFGSGYHYLRIFLVMFTGVHILCVFLYQLSIVQPIIPPDNINTRYASGSITNIGLTHGFSDYSVWYPISIQHVKVSGTSN